MRLCLLLLQWPAKPSAEPGALPGFAPGGPSPSTSPAPTDASVWSSESRVDASPPGLSLGGSESHPARPEPARDSEPCGPGPAPAQSRSRGRPRAGSPARGKRGASYHDSGPHLVTARFDPSRYEFLLRAGSARGADPRCWRTTRAGSVGEPARPHGLVTRITVLAAGFCPAARTARSASRPGFGPAARLSAALGRAHARAPSGGWEGPVLRAGQGCSSAGREILPSQLSEKGPARPAPGRRRRRVTSLRGGGRVLRGLQHERRAAVQGRKPPRCETRVRGRRGDSANPGSENTRLPRRFAKRGRRCGP